MVKNSRARSLLALLTLVMSMAALSAIIHPTSACFGLSRMLAREQLMQILQRYPDLMNQGGMMNPYGQQGMMNPNQQGMNNPFGNQMNRPGQNQMNPYQQGGNPMGQMGGGGMGQFPNQGYNG